MSLFDWLHDYDAARIIGFFNPRRLEGYLLVVGMQPPFYVDGIVYVGDNWLKAKAEEDPELMEILVIEELENL